MYEKETELTILSDKPPNYRAWLLRCWEEPGHREGEAAVWRFSLEDPYTGQRMAFANLNLLMEFLRTGLQGDEEDRG